MFAIAAEDRQFPPGDNPLSNVVVVVCRLLKIEKFVVSERRGEKKRNKTKIETEMWSKHTSIIKNTPVESPSIDVPNPASDWAVDQSNPKECKDHSRENTATLSNGTHNNGNGNGRELQL